MIIKISPRFERSYRRLPAKIKKEAKRKETIFRKNPFNPQLRTHKLKGEQKECWTLWINYSYRIKFIFLSDEEILFLDIGTHKIYK